MTSDAQASGPVLVPGAGRLPEGEARKVLIPAPDGDVDHPLEILLCRVGGRILALGSLCPHEGGRLAEGPLEKGRYAVCPLHLYKFDPTDGACVGIECDPATVYGVREVGDDVELWL